VPYHTMQWKTAIIDHFQKLNLDILLPDRWTKPNKTPQLLSSVCKITSVMLMCTFFVLTLQRTHI